MRRHLGILVAAVLICTGLASGASAGDRHGFGRGHGPPPIDRILERHADELGLSEEVRAQVRAIADESEQHETPLREALREQRDALHELLAQDAPDADSVLRQAEVIGAAETELHKQRLRTLLAVRTLLTPEQRQQLVKIFEEKRARMKGRWHQPPPDGPEPPAPSE